PRPPAIRRCRFRPRENHRASPPGVASPLASPLRTRSPRPVRARPIGYPITDVAPSWCGRIGMKAIEIRVQAGRTPTSYPILIGDRLLDSLGPKLARLVPDRRTIVVSSPRIWALHGAHIHAALPRAPHLLVPDGERAKRLSTVAKLYDMLVNARADRQTIM